MPYQYLCLAVACGLLVAGCGGGSGSAPASATPLPAGTVAFAAGTYTVDQSAGLLTVTVNRADGTRDVSVAYATADGTAAAGADYVARSGTLAWSAQDAAPKTISLPISAAAPRSADRTFTLVLSSPTNGLALGTPVATTVTITGVATPPAPAVSVQGNRLLDRSGNLLQLRGVSFSGFEFVAIGGWSPSDPSGGQSGQPNGPRWSAIKAWNANTVRLTLNETSWLGLTCVDTDGVTRAGDPGGNYRSAVATQVAEATAAGLLVILELHWAAPGNTCPMLQTQMANADHSIDFWTSVATRFAGNSAVMFSLYNEPFFFGLTSPQDEWSALMRGGTFSYYPATSGTHNYRNITTTWTSVGMQAMLDAVRATGATNVVLVAGVEFGNNLSNWLANMPRDSLNQTAAVWHPYPPMQGSTTAAIANAGTGYAVGDTLTLSKPNTVYSPAVLRVTSVGVDSRITGIAIENGGRYLQTALPGAPISQGSTSGTGSGATFSLGGWGNLSSTWSLPQNWPVVQALSVRFPVILSETGEHNATGTVGSPFLQQLLPFANANNWSVIGCCWNLFAEQDNVLIKDVDGTPSDGYGQVFREWTTGIAWQ